MYARHFLTGITPDRPLAPGRYDEALGLRVGPEGRPVVMDMMLKTTKADVDQQRAGMRTNGDIDRPRLGPVKTQADIDRPRMLGSTRADVDRPRRPGP